MLALWCISGRTIAKHLVFKLSMRPINQIFPDQEFCHRALASAIANLEGGEVVTIAVKGAPGLDNPKSAIMFLCPLV
jgi:hypothetical protein